MKNRHCYLIYNSSRDMFACKGQLHSVKNAGYFTRKSSEEILAGMFTKNGQTYSTISGAIKQLEYLQKFTKEELTIIHYESIPKLQYLVVEGQLVEKNKLSEALYS